MSRFLWSLFAAARSSMLSGRLILALSLSSTAVFAQLTGGHRPSARPEPWGAQHVEQTGISSAGDLWAPSPDGTIYLASTPPGTILRKVTTTGQQLFSTPLPGVGDLEPLFVGPDGDVYLSGSAAQGFSTTSGAYEPAPAMDAGFLCRFSGVDRHVIYCTYVDMIFGGLSADPEGNAYLESNWCFGFTVPGCIEKVNASGTALVYQFPIASFGANQADSVAADAHGNLYFEGSGPNGFQLVKFDPQGQILAALYDPGFEGYQVQIDPSGNPQVFGLGVVRKYRGDLSAILFETPANGLLISMMAIASDGSTVLFGLFSTANPSLVHPTASCDLPTGPSSGPNGCCQFSVGVLARLDVTGKLIQFTFAPVLGSIIPAGFAQPDSATILTETNSDQLKVVTFGREPQVELTCIGKSNPAFPFGAPLAPLAPQEMVSLYGRDLGPAQPVSAQPGPDGRYPLSLAGIQVTFDDIDAPLLSVSSNRIDTITPSASSNTTTHVCVTVHGTPTNCMNAPIYVANH